MCRAGPVPESRRIRHPIRHLCPRWIPPFARETDDRVSGEKVGEQRGETFGIGRL